MWQPVVRDLVHRVQRDVNTVLTGLDPGLVDVPGGPGTNPIGWLLWHLTRSHDRNVSELRGADQLWVVDRWHERWGCAPDPSETGYGHTWEQVLTFRSPPLDVVRGYHSDVVRMIDGYLAIAPDDDLHRLVTSPTLGNTLTVQRRLVGVIAEGLEHVGQAAALRGALGAGAGAHRRSDHDSTSHDAPEGEAPGG